MLKIIVTLNETRKVSVIVRPVSCNEVGEVLSRTLSKKNDLKETLKSLGVEQVSLSEILPKYKKNSKELIGKECTICQDVYKEREYSRKLKCGHMFHKKCIDRWLKQNPSCPICRHDLI